MADNFFSKESISNHTVEFDYIMESGKRVKIFQLPVFEATTFFTSLHGFLYLQTSSCKVFLIASDSLIYKKENFVDAVWNFRVGNHSSKI
jgi:hypothetical protein